MGETTMCRYGLTALLLLLVTLANACGTGPDTSAVGSAGQPEAALGSQSAEGQTAVAEGAMPAETDAGWELGNPQAVGVDGAAPGNRHEDPALPQRSMAFDLPAALAEIDALATPGNVDNLVFAELKDELARLLGEGPVAWENAERSASQTGEFWDTGFEVMKIYSSRPDAVFNSTTQSITAGYVADGDYDQNGLVNAADLVPLATALGSSAELGQLQRHIDGDRNGIVNIADIVTIARNFNTAPQMLLFGSTDIKDYPWNDDDANGVAPLAELTPQQAGAGTLREFRWSGFEPVAEMYYWIGCASSSRVSQISFDRKLMRYAHFSRLRYEAQEGLLQYDEYGIGDPDRNKYVTISDIDDWAKDYGKAYDDKLGSPYLHSLDYNEDGHIGSADMISVQILLGTGREELNVYLAMDESDLPKDEQIPLIGGPQPYATFSAPFIGRGGPPRADFATQEAYEATPWYQNYSTLLPDSLLWHELSLPDLPSGAWLWLRPVIDLPGGGQMLGYPSEVIQIP
jgi:hypothetical protein